MDQEIAEIKAILFRQQNMLSEIKTKVDKMSENASGSGWFGLARGVTLAMIYSKLTDLEKSLKDLKKR